MKHLIIGCVSLATLVVGCQFVRLNISDSLPLGFYRLQRIPAVVERGTIVLVTLPQTFHDLTAPADGGELTRAIHRWAMHMKPVVAVAGDQVCVLNGHMIVWYGSPEVYSVKDFGEVLTDTQGRAVPSAIPPGACTMIQPGFVWLGSDRPRSMDSRYYGPIAITQLRYVATPLWTWEE